jgi:flagellar protein FlgJ
MTLPVSNPGLYTDFNGIAELKRDAQAQDPKALREAARQFESLFTRMMLKSMRDASFGDPMLGSDQQDFYQGMFDDQFAIEMSRGRGLGLADMLVQQLTRAGLAPPTAPASIDPTAPPMKPNSMLNPYAPISSTTPERALAMVEQIDASGATADVPTAGWKSGDPESFTRALWPAAEKAGRELGIDPRHILALAALETGWGRSIPSDTTGRTSFNFFGIKAGSRWEGASVGVRTLEFENGLPVEKRERFRAYESPQACFRDYVALLRDNPRYAAALNTGANAHAFANALQRGGYATDPAYARKVTAIAQNLSAPKSTLKSADIRPMHAGTEPL